MVVQLVAALGAEDEVGKLGYGGDADEQVGDGAEKIVPGVEWLRHRHVRSLSLKKVSRLLRLGRVLRNDRW
jgi:hypothetical protein